VKPVLKHVSVETAQRRRTCYQRPKQAKNLIEAGDLCRIVVEAGFKIVDAAEDDLN
jgi:hypothetical protein